jgi:hypothetical protein
VLCELLLPQPVSTALPATTNTTKTTTLALMTGPFVEKLAAVPYLLARREGKVTLKGSVGRSPTRSAAPTRPSPAGARHRHRRADLRRILRRRALGPHDHPHRIDPTPSASSSAAARAPKSETYVATQV